MVENIYMYVHVERGRGKGRERGRERRRGRGERERFISNKSAQAECINTSIVYLQQEHLCV